MKSLQLSAIVLLVCGTVTLACFVGKAAIDGYTIFSFNPTDYPTTGQFGDFVGGVVGTFFALSGTLLIYMIFKEQAKENKRSAFESSWAGQYRWFSSCPELENRSIDAQIG